MKFKPVSHYGGWITAGLTGGTWLIAFILLNLLPEQTSYSLMFWLFILAGVFSLMGLYFAYQTFVLLSLVYVWTRNGLEVRWGRTRYRLPIADVQTITTTTPSALPMRRKFGLILPDWVLPNASETRFFNPSRTPDLLLVQAPDQSWVLSPENGAEFIRAWELRQNLGPTQIWQKTVLREGVLAWPIWYDKLAWLLIGGAVALGLVVMGSALLIYPSWPTHVPIHLLNFNQPDFIATSEQLLWLPVAGLAALVINLSLGLFWYRSEPMLAYLIWTVALVVQVMVWVALRVLVG